MNDAERHLMTIFSAALDHVSSADQDAYLDEACAGDAELRARIVALLRAHEHAGRLPGALGDEGRRAGTGTEPEAGVVTASALPVTAAWEDRSEARGAMIGPYKLLEEIGEGGMGTVYMAEQSRPVKRLVALKLTKLGMDSRQVIARFEAERQALALMDHPNIAKVLDAGATEQGRPYFVMELVKGRPITRYCDEHQLTPRQRLELFIPVCQAVQHAHQKGIIHRDLKPSNVLVGVYDGRPVPKVIDFGVAKATGQRLTEVTLYTGFGAVVGTLDYMSPEQARLDNVDVDTRSDIYSLGVLLYELLTGTTPIGPKRLKQGAMLELLRIIREEEPPRPSTRLDSTEELPSIAASRGVEPRRLSGMMRGELDWIVMKALEKDRTRRYETANGLLMDLQRYLADEPVQACPPSASYRFRKFARRNRALLATGLGVGLAVLLAMVVLGVSYARIRVETQAKEVAFKAKGEALSEARTNYEDARKQERRAEAQRAIAQENEGKARDQTALANRHLYASQMNLAMQAARAGELPRTLELLEGQRPTESGEDLRGFEWYHLWRLCHGTGRIPIKGHTGSVLGLAFSPDSGTLASAGWDETVRLRDSATGAERMVLRGHRRVPWAVAHSPDGRVLASFGQEATSLILWDATTGKPLHTISRSVGTLAFSPDGKTLAAGVEVGDRIDVVFWDTATGAEMKRIEAGGHVVGFTPDGKALITFTGRYSIMAQMHCRELEHNRPRYQVAVPAGLNAAFLSPDRTRILVATGGGTEIFEGETGARLKVFPSLMSARGLALSNDNKLLARGLENRRVIVANLETGQPVLEDMHLNSCWTVAFSPDGTKLASASMGGAIHLRDLAASVDPPPVAVKDVRDLVFSADGKRLFFANEGRTRIVDVAEGGRSLSFHRPA